MQRMMKSNRNVAGALVAAVALAWFVPMDTAHAQSDRSVSMGRPGDHWASMLDYTSIRRGERNGAYGYVVKLRAADGCEVELFYPRSEIDFQGKGRTWRNFKLRVKTGWLYYPSRLNATSLPKVHSVLVQIEDSYQRQADGAIAAAQGFAIVATLGTMTPAPRPAPLPRATRPAPAPRAAPLPRATRPAPAPRTAPAPRAFDNQGRLARNAGRPDVQRRIIDGRIRHLENEIRTFEKRIEALRSGSVKP